MGRREGCEVDRVEDEGAGGAVAVAVVAVGATAAGAALGAVAAVRVGRAGDGGGCGCRAVAVAVAVERVVRDCEEEPGGRKRERERSSGGMVRGLEAENEPGLRAEAMQPL